ncbi:hypothetical protein REPUB_Repub06bG0023000 [Reevesia pubescens]
MSSAPICHLTSCQAWDLDLQYPEDNFWPFKILEINVKATFIVSQKTQEDDEEDEGKKLLVFESPTRRIVQEESHRLPIEQLLNDVDDKAKDLYDTNICDVFDSMQIPIQRSMLDKIIGCAMAAMESYKNRKVLRMRVEIEALVDEQPNLAEGDAYSIDVEADDFWETVQAFRKLRKMVVENQLGEDNVNVCSICLGEFLVGSEISATPCSHVFHDRCIRAWLKKCSKKSCPNCVSILA